MLCEVVAHHAQAGLLSQLFGLYLDEQEKPLPELMAFALPQPLIALGPGAQVQLLPTVPCAVGAQQRRGLLAAGRQFTRWRRSGGCVALRGDRHAQPRCAYGQARTEGR